MHRNPAGRRDSRIPAPASTSSRRPAEAKRMKPRFLHGALAVVLTAPLLQLGGCVSRPAWHGDEGAAYDILNQSTIALTEIDRKALDGPLGTAMRQACAVFVFPGARTGVPATAAARGNGVLLVRDPASGHWNGPAFYALRRGDEGHVEHMDRRTWVIAVGCRGLRQLYAQAGPSPGTGGGLDDTTRDDMTAWALSGQRFVPASLADVAVRPLPAITAAYYQAPAPIQAILVDRSVRNDASAEIQSAIELVQR
jgi:hypothetical protein